MQLVDHHEDVHNVTVTSLRILWIANAFLAIPSVVSFAAWRYRRALG